jgi:anaerobic selenocysteine-containing dehydrogenase
MLDAAGGEVKALFVMGANPASERPTWAENLDKLDFLVVQELFLTETAAKADVVLPAVSWAEQDGTFTNLERRVQRAPKALGNPQSKAAPDWMILDHLATFFDAQWGHASAQAVTAEIAQAAPIYAGLTWEAHRRPGLTVERGRSQLRAAGVELRPRGAARPAQDGRRADADERVRALRRRQPVWPDQADEEHGVRRRGALESGGR